MQAVIETGGKQYVVAQGNKVLIDKIEGDIGAAITFDKVLLINGDSAKVGAPYVAGAKVTAKIVDQEKAKKIIVFKYKRRKGYHKRRGHRQLGTRVMIETIVG